MKSQQCISKIIKETTPLFDTDFFLIFDRLKKDFEFPIHYHLEYELNLILGPPGLKRIVNNSYQFLSNNDLVFLAPNVQHGWLVPEQNQYEYREITIQFAPDIFQNIIKKNALSSLEKMFHHGEQGISFNQKTIDRILPIINLLISNKCNFPILNFLEIFLILAESPYHTISEKESSINSYTLSENENIDKLYQYIQKNYNTHITVKEASDFIHMTPSTFSRYVKKHTGKSFIDFLNYYRINKACRLMIEKNFHISEIAFMCGFNNIANFNRIFKKIKYTTPSEWIQNFNGVKHFT